jgi:two-component system response regulator LytT
MALSLREGGASMKVECKVSADYKEPYAVLYISEITETVAELVSMLEKEHAGSFTLAAAKDKKTYFIRPEDISLIRTEGREIACYDRQGDRYLLHKPLYELENMLDPSFVRISKSAIANIRQIGHVEAGFNGTMELVMKNGTIDYISRSFRKNFKERLGLT